MNYQQSVENANDGDLLPTMYFNGCGKNGEPLRMSINRHYVTLHFHCPGESALAESIQFIRWCQIAKVEFSRRCIKILIDDENSPYSALTVFFGHRSMTKMIRLSCLVLGYLREERRWSWRQFWIRRSNTLVPVPAVPPASPPKPTNINDNSSSSGLTENDCFLCFPVPPGEDVEDFFTVGDHCGAELVQPISPFVPYGDFEARLRFVEEQIHQLYQLLQVSTPQLDTRSISSGLGGIQCMNCSQFSLHSALIEELEQRFKET